MKKFIVITAIVILLIILFFVGTFKYRQYSANQILIPEKTTAIVKISVDEFYKTLALNMISHIGYYLKPEEKESIAQKTKDINAGLKIPASIYFYSIEGKSKTTFFSRFTIKNHAEFSNFIKQNLHFNISKSKTSGLTQANSADGKYVLLYNQKTVAVALSDTANDVEQSLVDVLNQKDYVKIKGIFESINKAHEHFAYIDKDYKANIDFINGAAKFTVEFLAESFTPAVKPQHRNLDSLNTVSMWLNLNFEKAENKTYKQKAYSLERDSLLKYQKGYLDFEWTNTTQQTDSVVTYEFNDNFEKAEKVTVQTKDVPNLLAHLEADATGLMNYLNQQQIIDKTTGLVNKAAFPLYKVFVAPDKNSLNFSTKKDYTLNLGKVNDQNFFSLNVDFNEINNQIKSSLLTEKFKVLKGLQIKGKSMGEKKVKFYGNVIFQNEDINGLYQILRSY